MAIIGASLCESDDPCEHRIPDEVYESLDAWRKEDDRDRDDDLYIVHSECAKGFPVLHSAGDCRVIRDYTSA